MIRLRNLTEIERATKALSSQSNPEHSSMKYTFLLDESLISAEYSIKPLKFCSASSTISSMGINLESSSNNTTISSHSNNCDEHEFNFLILQSNKIRLSDSCFAILYPNGSIKHRELIKDIYPVLSRAFFGHNLFLLLTKRNTFELRNVFFSEIGLLNSNELDSICFIESVSVKSPFEIYQSASTSTILCIWTHLQTLHLALLKIGYQKGQPKFDSHQKRIKFSGTSLLTSSYFSSESINVLLLACVSYGKLCLIFMEWENEQEPNFYRMALSSIRTVSSISIINPEFSFLSTNMGTLLMSHSQIKSLDSSFKCYGDLFTNVNSSFTFSNKHLSPFNSTNNHRYCSIILMKNTTIYAVISSLQGDFQYSRLLKLKKIDRFYFREYHDGLLTLEVATPYSIQLVMISLNALSFYPIHMKMDNFDKKLTVLTKIYDKYKSPSAFLSLPTDSSLWVQSTDYVVQIDPIGNLIQNTMCLDSFSLEHTIKDFFLLELNVHYHRNILNCITGSDDLLKEHKHFLFLCVDRMNFISFRYLIIKKDGESVQEKVLPNFKFPCWNLQIVALFALKDRILIATSKEVWSLSNNENPEILFSSDTQILTASLYEPSEEIVIVEKATSNPNVIYILIWSYVKKKMIYTFTKILSDNLRSVKSATSKLNYLNEEVVLTITTTWSIEFLYYSKGILKTYDKLFFERDHNETLSENAIALLKVISRITNSKSSRNMSALFSITSSSRYCVCVHSFNDIHVIFNGQVTTMQIVTSSNPFDDDIFKVELSFSNNRLKFIFVLLRSTVQIFQTLQVTNSINKVVLNTLDKSPISFQYLRSLQRLLMYDFKNHEFSALKLETGKKVSIINPVASMSKIHALKEIEFDRSSHSSRKYCHILLVGDTKTDRRLVIILCELYAKNKALILKQRKKLDLTPINENGQTYHTIITALDHNMNEFWLAIGPRLICVNLCNKQLSIRKSFNLSSPIQSLNIAGNFISVVTGKNCNHVHLAQIQEINHFGPIALLPLNYNHIIHSITHSSFRIKFIHPPLFCLAIYGNINPTNAILLLAHINNYGFTSKLDTILIPNDPVDIQLQSHANLHQLKLLHKNGKIHTIHVTSHS